MVNDNWTDVKSWIDRVDILFLPGDSDGALETDSNSTNGVNGPPEPALAGGTLRRTEK